MVSINEIPLTFRLNRNWKQILFTTLLGITFYQIINLLRPEYGELKPLFEGRIKDYLKDFLGYYLFFEWISVIIFIGLNFTYTTFFKMRSLKPGWKALFIYNIKYLPLIIFSIFIFAPITNGIRYLAFHFPHYSWNEYFPEFFFHAEMYRRYFVPLFFLGLGYLNYNIFLDYNDWQKIRFREKLKQKKEVNDKYLKLIEAFDNQGDTILNTQSVWWFEVENKSYFAHTSSKVFTIKKTISELEEELKPSDFFRVNRSIIINLAHFKNYSHWEYDKYVVRLNDNKTEFIMQRSRLKDLKEKLSVIKITD